MRTPDNEEHIIVLLDFLKGIGSEAEVSLYRVRQHLSRCFDDSAAADGAIQRAIEMHRVEPVLDFDKDESSPMRHTWHLRWLDDEERTRMNAICRACRTLLRLLWNTHDPESLGWLRAEEVHQSLKAAGLSEEEVQSVGGEITDRVEIVAKDSERGSNKPVLWYRLIPEYERHPSHDYSEALRKADREFMEKEALREQLLEEEKKQQRKGRERRKARPHGTRRAEQ